MGLHSGASTYAFEASPLVVDGVMFVSGWDGQCWAIDAANGNELWRYRHASPFDVSLCCGNVNRGVAVAEGKVFMTTLNAHIIALDAETGKKVWDQTVRRRAGRRERHGRAADRQGHGHRRQLRRRVRRRAATPTRSSSRPASACGAAT